MLYAYQKNILLSASLYLLGPSRGIVFLLDTPYTQA